MLGGQIEIAIRDWARQDPEARKVVARVDDERLNYLARQYSALGLSEDAALARALMQVSFSTGNGIIFGMRNKAKRTAAVDTCLDLLMSGLK